MPRNGSRLFSVAPSNRTRDNRQKLKSRKLHLNKRKSFFTVRVTKLEQLAQKYCRVSLERSLELFKSCLDKRSFRKSCLNREVGLDDLQYFLLTPVW